MMKYLENPPLIPPLSNGEKPVPPPLKAGCAVYHMQFGLELL